MSVEPLGVGKVSAAAVSAVSATADAATRPNGPVSRLLGLDLVRQEMKGLQDDLARFVAKVEEHHTRHEQSTQAIGMLLSEFKHLQDRVSDRLDAVTKLAEVRADAQDRALRDFEARLVLFGEIVKARKG